MEQHFIQASSAADAAAKVLQNKERSLSNSPVRILLQQVTPPLGGQQGTYQYIGELPVEPVEDDLVTITDTTPGNVPTVFSVEYRNTTLLKQGGVADEVLGYYALVKQTVEPTV